MTINTWFEQNFTNVPEVVKLFARATGAGAADLTALKGMGVTSITRTGVGLHTITLARKFAGLLNLVGNVIDVTTPDDWEVQITTDLTNNQTIGIAVYKGGVAAELTSDEKLLLEITLQDSAVKPSGF